MIKKQDIRSLLKKDTFGGEVIVNGWVRSKRESKNITFLSINDGSTIDNIQIVVNVDDLDNEKLLSNIHIGAALSIIGKLVESVGSKQKIEIYSNNIKILGFADLDYPIQSKKHSLEFLREKIHLRYRTNTFGAIVRIRHSMIFAIHKYFNDNGFFNVHTPIITDSDAEGAGDMFQVTTLDLKNIQKNGIDFNDDFFGKSVNLTVSGQLEAELVAMGLSKVYTFGPTFRAENSNTSRHLAEFWMVEPEVAFFDINDNMDLAEDMLKYVINYVLKNCIEDLMFLNKRLVNEEKNKKVEDRFPMELIDKLHFIVDNEFIRITYTESINILRNSKFNKRKRFKYIIKDWGIDLQSEHERYLVEKYFKRPVIVTDYPKDVKSFYMKQNNDKKTVRAMDVLFPQIGEIVGGSQREDNYDRLYQRMKDMGISEKSMWWYLDTRRYGTVPHSGFGLGFDRFVMFITGMNNIRDVIPFPRTPKKIGF